MRCATIIPVFLAAMTMALFPSCSLPYAEAPAEPAPSLPSTPAIDDSGMPQAAKNDPRFKLGYLVVTHYEGVSNDGTGDSTAGIQQAIDDALANHLVVYFPVGVYLVSDTLGCYKWLLWNAAKNKAWSGPEAKWEYSHYLQGEEKDGRRPLIKLAKTASLFDNRATPRPIVKFGGFVADNENGGSIPGRDSFDPLAAPPNFHKDSTYSFYQQFRSIDIDCGGHPGAIGLSFSAAQYSAIINVRVNAHGAFIAFDGLPGRNMGAANIEAQGGEIGIRVGQVAGATVVGAKLYHQEIAAIEDNDFVPTVFVGIHIIKDSSPAIKLGGAIYNEKKVTGCGAISFIDGIVEVNDMGTAIDNRVGSGLYLKNLYVKGTDTLLQSGSRKAIRGQGGASLIREYAYTQPFSGERTLMNYRTYNIIDGKQDEEEEPVVRVEPVQVTPTDSDILSRHLWSALPTFDGAIAITDPPYSATGNDESDDTAAIQNAIDAAAKAGHGRVFVPAGTYHIGKTITLHRNTALFGAELKTSVIKTHGDWKPEREAFMIDTDDDASASTFLGFLCLVSVSRHGQDQDTIDPYDHFSYVRWRAGRNSMSINLMIDDEPWTIGVPTSPKRVMSFTGNGGGRHYFVCPNILNTGNKDMRSVLVSGTTEPLAFYGLNVEGHVVPENRQGAGWMSYQACCEMIDAKNIRIYGIKREGVAGTIIFRNCSNVGFYSSGAMRENVFKGCGGYVQVLGNCANVEMANLLVQIAHEERIKGEPLFSENIDGQKPLQVTWPEGIGLYKRGEADDHEMRR